MVAGHTRNHPRRINRSDEEIVKEVEENWVALSELVGYDVVGFPYPCGTEYMDACVADVIRTRTGIRYARTTISMHKFDSQDDLIVFNPTVHHSNFDKLFALAQDFLALKTDKPQVFYILGHAYELDVGDTWTRFEEFCRLISGHDDIFYGTNREVLLEPFWDKE